MPHPALPSVAFLFALGAAAAFAALDLTQKWTSRYAVTSPASLLALRLMAGAILSPLLLLLPGAMPALPVQHIPPGVLVGAVVVNLIGNGLYLWSIYRADISVLGSLWPLKNFYLLILAFILPPKEHFSPLVYAFILMATLGAMGIAYNERLKLKALTESPVRLMALVTIPVFALSDKLLGNVAAVTGGALSTVILSEGVALIGLPLLLADSRTRKAVVEGIQNVRGVAGALLTGLFLILGIACISEAFAQARGQVVLVNVFAMLSGLILLLVNAAVPGWLDRSQRSVYLVRFAGAIVLVAAAILLQIYAK